MTNTRPKLTNSRLKLTNKYRHLAITLFASFFSLYFTNDLMEGCAPTVVRGTKYDEDLMAVEPLPLTAVADVDCLELSIPKAASWAFFAAAASFFPSFTWSASCTTLISFGSTFKQGPTSCPGILAKWYFNLVIPLVISCPHNLQFNLCRLDPSSGIPCSQNGSKAFGIFAMEIESFQIWI